MTTTDTSASEGARATASLRAAHITIAWFLKRSALWAAILFVAVFLACLLYGVASKAGPETGQSSKPAASAVKV